MPDWKLKGDYKMTFVKYKVYLRIKHRISSTVVEALDGMHAKIVALKYFPKAVVASITKLR